MPEYTPVPAKSIDPKFDAFQADLARQQAKQARDFKRRGYGADDWEYQSVDASERSFKMEEEQGGGQFQRLGLGPKPWGEDPRPPSKDIKNVAGGFLHARGMHTGHQHTKTSRVRTGPGDVRGPTLDYKASFANVWKELQKHGTKWAPPSSKLMKAVNFQFLPGTSARADTLEGKALTDTLNLPVIFYGIKGKKNPTRTGPLKELYNNLRGKFSAKDKKKFRPQDSRTCWCTHARMLPTELKDS